MGSTVAGFGISGEQIVSREEGRVLSLEKVAGCPLGGSEGEVLFMKLLNCKESNRTSKSDFLGSEGQLDLTPVGQGD